MTMKNAAAIAAFGITLAGCATSGPTYGDLQTTQPAIAANSGRIYMYRESSMFGYGISPNASKTQLSKM
jgi:hypothetical protein